MAEDPREVNRAAGRAPASAVDRPQERDRTPAEIRQDIQRTRADIDQALDSIGEELRPQRVLWHARREIEPEVRAAADRVTGKVKENPRPLIAAGATALGLFALRALVKRRKRKKRGFPPEQKGM